MSDDQDPELALVVGAARSGTTLLRLLLDAHPQIGCPAEAGLPALMAHMARTWWTINADRLQDTPQTDPGNLRTDGPDEPTRKADAEEEKPVGRPMTPVPEACRSWIRSSVLHAMRQYCEPLGKRVYVDKSLDSVFHLDLARQVFPRLRCVLAFRHVMDTIASGIDASPWGFQAYGFGPYVQASPNNTVAALARYWLDHVTQALEWEKRHPGACLRVRYEDLVVEPDKTVLCMQRFLGVEPHTGVLHDAFDREPLRGPGDYKVGYTNRVHTGSIGHGKRVPVSMLPPPLLGAINEKLTALGYPALDRSWNTAERTIAVERETIWTEQLQDLMRNARVSGGGTASVVFALVSEDHRASRWVLDTNAGTVCQGDGDVESVLTGTTQDLVLLLTDQENVGTLLRSGRIRHVAADKQGAASDATRERLDAMIQVLRTSVPVGVPAQGRRPGELSSRAGRREAGPGADGARSPRATRR